MYFTTAYQNISLSLIYKNKEEKFGSWKCNACLIGLKGLSFPESSVSYSHGRFGSKEGIFVVGHFVFDNQENKKEKRDKK